MKNALVTLAAAIAAGNMVRTASATDYAWQPRGTSVTTAGNWNSSSSWLPSGVPGAGDKVTFPAYGSYVLYATSAVPMSVGQLYFSGQKIADASTRFAVVSDAALTLSANNTHYNCAIYAPVTMSSVTMGRYVSFCDKVSIADGCQYIGNYGRTEFRFDRFAKSSAATRVNDLSQSRISSATAEICFYGVQALFAPTSSVWSSTAGSPYLSPVSIGHALPAGTSVACTGVLPPGAFLKRIFPDGTIEVSEPALSTDAAAAISFAAFNPAVRQTFTLREHAGNITLHANAWTEDDDFLLTVENVLYTVASRLTIGTSDGCVPARIAFSGAASDATKAVTVALGDCRVELTGTLPGATNGFARVTLTSAAESSVSRLSVPSGMTHSALAFSGLVGVLRKEGGGTFSMRMDEGSDVNTGTLSVADGTLAVTANSGVVPGVAHVEIASGATLRIPAGGMCANTLSVTAGAKLSGPGTLTVAVPCDISGLMLIDGAAIAFSSSSLAEVGVALNTMPGNPAFWVDCSRIGTMDVVVSGETNFVSRIDDVRGAAYGFATNASGGVHMPYLVAMQNGLTALRFRGNLSGAASTNAGDYDTLVWKDVVYGIRHVFQVFDGVRDEISNMDGGGQYLGTSSREPGNYMLRDPGSQAQKKAIFYNTADNACCRNGTFRINGEVYDTTQCYPYFGYYNTTTKKTDYLPVVTDLKPVEPYPPADTFDFNCVANGRGGRKQLCELVVYTNEVSEADRVAITSYLMRKWNGCEMSYTASGAAAGDLGTFSGGEIALAAGASASVSLAAGGTLVKTGAGSLSLASGELGNASLSVEEGTLSVPSTRLDASCIPAGLAFHFDPSDVSSVTYDVVDGVTNVSAWADVRGAGHAQAVLGCAESTNRPTLRAKAALGGKPVMDFGVHCNLDKTAWNAVKSNPKFVSALTFAATGLHTVVAVWGSERGGGSLVGSWGEWSYNNGYGLIRGGTYGSLASDYALLQLAKPYSSRTEFYPHTYRFSLDGVTSDPHSTPLSGGFQTASYTGLEAFGSKGFSYHSSGSWHVCGGEQFGEYMLFTNGLSVAQTKLVEAYLGKKWFGADSSEYGEAAVSNLSVAAGATVRVAGNGALYVASLVCSGGTIDGDLVVPPGGVFTAVVGDDGTIAPTTVSGSVALGGAVVRFARGANRAAPGRYVLVASPSISAGDDIGCTVDASGLGQSRFVRLVARDGAIEAEVSKSGLVVVVK